MRKCVLEWFPGISVLVTVHRHFPNTQTTLSGSIIIVFVLKQTSKICCARFQEVMSPRLLLFFKLRRLPINLAEARQW